LENCPFKGTIFKLLLLIIKAYPFFLVILNKLTFLDIPIYIFIVIKNTATYKYICKINSILFSFVSGLRFWFGSHPIS